MADSLKFYTSDNIRNIYFVMKNFFLVISFMATLIYCEEISDENNGNYTEFSQQKEDNVNMAIERLEGLETPIEVHETAGPSSSANEHTDMLRILDSLLREYDRRATPTNHLGVATEVECKLYVRSLGSINPDTMDYQVDLYLRQHWSDTRLEHEDLVDPLDLNDPNLVKAIWKPEVYFPNAKDAEFQYVTVPNVLVRIDPGGQILYMLRLKLKFSCMMELSKFPLDEQICTMEIASFSKTTKELILRWKKDRPIDISSEVKMPQFEISNIDPAKCQETFHIGNYSCLLAKLHLKRSLGFHMVQSYLPTILIVVISWVSFWMDVDSVAGRTTLGVTTLLTVSSKASDVQAEVPLVSYVKAIDIWMGACTGFIFAALLEFTLTNYLWRKGTKVSESERIPTDNGHKKDLGPIEAAASAVASGLDPSMFTQMMSASAVTSNALVNEHVVRNHVVDLDEEKMPLTSPAHNLLKKRNKLSHRSSDVHTNYSYMNSEQKNNDHIELADQNMPMIRKTVSCDDSRIVSEEKTLNGRHVHETEVVQGRSGADCRIVTFDEEATATNDITDNWIDSKGKSHKSAKDRRQMMYCRMAIRIDELSRILFPMSFGFFNVFYWTYYTQWA